MYIARTEKDFLLAVKRDEPEIKLMGEAMETYQVFMKAINSSAKNTGFGTAGFGLGGAMLGGPIGAAIGATVGASLSMIENRKRNKDIDKVCAEASYKNLRTDLKKYYKVSSKGSSYIILTHK